MIISASRRTDIPAFYSEWLFNRIKEGYVYVRNPMNAHQISQISLSPDVVDGIVFWTKNPILMLSKLDALKEYTYYFQFTITPYGSDMEKNIPDKDTKIIPAFQKLSDLIGPDRVIWRYDPIFLNEKYGADEHLAHFEKMAKLLSPHTRKCTISFLDFYANMSKEFHCDRVSVEKLRQLAKGIAEIAHSYGLRIDTCAEKIDLSEYGIGHAKCIDGELFEKLTGVPLETQKDSNQRSECGCMKSIDIGAYNTCVHNCLYCYATHNYRAACKNHQEHDPNSPLLIGNVGPEDKITVRQMASIQINQLQFEI